MEYNYHIRIALKDIEPTDEFVKLFTIECDLLSNRDWFPVIGGEEPTIGSEYGSGPNEHFEEEIILLTSKFPEYTFYVYFFFKNMICLHVYEIKDKTVILLHKEYLYEGIQVPGSKICITFDSGCNVDNDIFP